MTIRPTREQFGATFWVLGVTQFLAVHLLVESRWNTGYSWAHNNVSDLGNVACGQWTEDAVSRYVCSPWHVAMNVSFLLLGVSIPLGVVMVRQCWNRGFLSWIGGVGLFSAGIGYIFVGAYPADVDLDMHVLGALLIFGLGNLGLILSGIAGPWRFAIPLGLLALAGSYLHLDGQYFGLGIGGMERVALLPLLAWAFVSGVFILTNRYTLSGHQMADRTVDEHAPGAH